MNHLFACRTKKFTISIFLLFISACLGAQIPIGYYDFEDNLNRNTTVQTSFQEAVSTIGSPSISTGSLIASHGDGNGLASTYGGINTGYAIGYYGFTTNLTSVATNPSIQFGPFNCTGFSTLSLSMDIQGIGAKMPTNVDVYYSLNNITYTRIVATTTVTTTFTTRNFTIPVAANGQSTVYFRIIGFGAGAAPTATDGVMKVDNFTLQSSLITANTTLVSAPLHGEGLSSGGSYVPAYTSLRINGAGITVNSSSNLILGTTATTTALILTNGEFNVGNNTLTLQNANTLISRTTGTLTLGSSANLVIGRAGNLGGNAFAIPANVFTSAPTIANLTVNRTNALTWNTQNITLDGTLTLTSGALSIGAITCTFQNATTPIVRTTGTLTVATTTNLVVGANATNFTLPNNTFTAAPSINNLTINRVGGVTIGNQAFTINGTLNLIDGAFNILNTTLSFQTGATPINRTSGTITTATGSSLSFGANATNFIIPDNTFTTAPNITNLTVNRAGGVTIGNQAFTVNGALTLTSGVLNVLNTTLTFQNGNTPIVRNGTTQTGTLTLGTTSNLIFGTAGNLGGNAFTIPANIFTAAPSIASLTVNRTNALGWNAQVLTLSGNLNLVAGTLNNATNINVNGNITGSGIVAGAGTLIMATGGSSISGATASNIQLNNALGFSLTGSPTITGTLTLTNGALTVGANTLTFQTGNTPIARNGTTQIGTLSVGTSSNLIFGTNTTNFTIPDNTFVSAPSINNLTINRVGGLTIGNQNITINGTLILTNGAFNILGSLLSFETGLTPIVRTGGTINTTTSSNLYFGNSVTNFTLPNNTFTAAPSINNIIINRVGGVTIGNQAFTINGTLNLIDGAFNILNTTLSFQTGATPINRTSGTITTATGSSLSFGANATNFIIPDNTFTTAPNITNLTVNRAGGVTIGNQAFTVNGALTLTSGVLNVLNTTLTFQNGNTPIVRNGTTQTGTLTLGTTSNLIFGTAGNLGGNAFAIPANVFTSAPSIANLTINRTNALTWNAQNITLDGTLTLTSGALSIGAITCTFQNAATPIARTTGTLTVATTTNLVFGANAANFTLPNNTFTAAPSINNLTINRVGGVTIGNQAFTINGTLNLIDGAFNILNTTLSFQTGATPINRTSGTITTATGSSLSFGANATNFIIPDNTFTTAPNITNLTVNRAGGVTIGNQAFTINGALTLTSGVLNVLNTTLTFQNGNTPIVRNGTTQTGTLTLGTTSNLIFGTAGNLGGNAFTIPANIFTVAPSIASLTVNRTNALGWNVQVLTLSGNLNLVAGTINNATNINVNGNITGSGIVAGTGTLIMATGGSSISGATVSNIQLNNATGFSLTGSPVITGTLTLTNGALTVGANSLTFQTGNTPIARNGTTQIGTLTLSNSSNLVFGTLGNLGGNAFTIPANVFTTAPSLNNLTINRTNALNWNAQNITLDGTLTLTSAVFNVGGITYTFQNATTPIVRTTGTLTVATTSSLIFGANAANFTIPNNTFTSAPIITNLTINRVGGVTIGNQAFTITGTLNLLNGAFDILNTTLSFQTGATPITRTNGTITTATGSNLSFGTNATAFSIPVNTFTSAAPSINNLTINRVGGITLSNQSLTINGSLILTNGFFNIGNTTLTLQNADLPLIRTNGTLTVGGSSSIVFGTVGNMGGAAFTIPDGLFTSTPPSFANFTINRSNAVTLNTTQGLTLSGNLNLLAGTLNNAGRTINVSGNITGTATVSGTGLVLMTTATTSISGASISNLELNNATGFSLSGSPIITGTLTLTNGALDVINNTLTFQNGNTPIVRTAGSINLNANSSLVFGTTGNTAGNAFVIPNNCFTSSTPTFANFTIHRTNSLTLNNQNFSLTGVLNISGGQLILPTNYLFTLKSTSITNTALVAPVGLTGSIVYNTGAAFRVERFIPQTGGTGRRAYRDIAPAVNSGTGKIFDNWQESGTNGLVGGTYYGTHITGFAGATNGVNLATGFDVTASGSRTLFTNDINVSTGNSAWITATSTNQSNDTLSAFKGYRVLIRGNRLVNLYQTPTPTTMNADAILRSTGKLVTGDVAFTTTGVTANGATNTGIRLNSGSATGFTLIGNPYQSPVDWDLLFTDPSTTNLSSTYTLWDPNLGSTGAYATYNQATGISAPLGSAINKFIQPGQAIFVQNTATNPTLTFKESHKATNTSNLTTTFRAQATVLPTSTIYIDLKKQIDANFGVIDGVAITYGENYSNSIGAEDSYKFENFEENISINSNKQQLSIEGRQEPTVNDIIQLNMSAIAVGKSYEISINLQQFTSNGLQAYLNDGFNNQQIKLNMGGISNYSFERVQNETNLENRFSIVFKPNASTVTLKQIEKLDLPTQIAVYPNPVKNKTIHLQFNNLKEGNYNVQVVNMNGQAVFTEKYVHAGGDANKLIQLSHSIVAGIYHVLISNSNYRNQIKIVVE